MTSGLDNLSLALFTALAPAGVVAFIVLALARIFSADHDRAVRIDRMIALPFAVALLGFIASATHLGTPANALHVFAGVARHRFPTRYSPPWCSCFLAAPIGWPPSRLTSPTHLQNRGWLPPA